MSQLRPFQALRPIQEKAAEIAAVPYDVVNRDEAAALAQEIPLNFLHVSRAEIDLPVGVDPYSDQVYEKAKKNFRNLIESEVLQTDSAPRIYIYRLKKGSQQQTGIFATYSIDEYDSEKIKKHERTRKDKEDDRTRHLLTLEAQTGPVFLAYRGLPEINHLVSQIASQKPLYDFTAVDGVTHTLWSATETDPLVQAFKKVSLLYIADGHHRAASASRARAELRAKNPHHSGNEAYNYVLAVAFPAEELRILPYHRTLKDLYGQSDQTVLNRLSETFVVTPHADPTPIKGEFSMYLSQQWYRLQPRFSVNASTSVTEALDVSVLQNQVLDPIFGIKDPRTDKRIDFVGGIRGTDELKRLVDSGQAAVAFSMHPTSLDDLMKVADQGEIMPPKSTWFEPKLRDGLLSHWIG